MLFIVSYLIIPLPQIQVPKWIILRLCLNSNSKAPNWHQRKWNELNIFIIVILLRPRKNNSQSLKELELSINKQWRSQVHMCQEKRQHQFQPSKNHNPNKKKHMWKHTERKLKQRICPWVLLLFISWKWFSKTGNGGKYLRVFNYAIHKPRRRKRNNNNNNLTSNAH